MSTFLRNLAGVKVDKAAQAGIEALVRWDPKSASEAELRTMEQNLDALGSEVALARQGYDREKREADTIQALSHQRMAAAEQLQRQMDSESDPTGKAAVERSSTTLVGMLEQMTPEVEREKQDEVDAKDYLHMLEQTYAEAGGKLKRRVRARAGAARTWHSAAQQREQADPPSRGGAPGSRARQPDQRPDGGTQGHAGRGAEGSGFGRRANEQGAVCCGRRDRNKTTPTSPPRWPLRPASRRGRRA